MRGHDRDLLQREYLDEYEEDGEELDDDGQYEDEDGEEEEEYEEDVPKPTQEELEYLEIRQRLKEAARKRLRKEAAAALGNAQGKKAKLPNDNFGSFFGPSQPVIAKRVIEERQSILESQQHLASMKLLSQSGPKKGHASTTNGAKSGVQQQRPKVVNQLKQKVQKLKDTRDYSFLLSDDTDIPAPVKDPPPRSAPAPRSDARPAQASLKSKSLMSKPTRPLLNSHQDRAVLPKDGVTQKLVHSKMSMVNKPVSMSADPRKQLGNNAGNGSRGPVGLKPVIQKAVVPITNKKPMSSASKASAQSTKHSIPSVQKAPLAKPHTSVRKLHTEQRREPQLVEKLKMVSKQPASSSKPQMRPPLPLKSIASHSVEDNRRKKKALSTYRDDDDDAIRMIRNMFRYDPSKFKGDDDVSDMEANFDDIQREERRSAKIAREEDERELRLIEEEERTERMRKEAKRRRLSSHS